MKKFGILAVMSLLMMFSCAKDDLINTEQGPFSIEENNQPVINGARPGSATMSVSGISFFGTSTKSDLAEGFVNGCLPSTRKLLKYGTFSGKLAGYGTINSSLSIYAFTACEKAPIDSPPNYGEPLMYKLTAEGKLSLGTRDYCFITITGNLYPWFYVESNFDGGLFIGKATTHSGVGKLKGLSKTFQVYRSGMNIYGINLQTGEISLNIRD
ncbi:MAG: hypothetical protein Q7U59_11640 [Lutibacter sp.]|nr:hypothetical protein [Lutibacter sp.]